MNQFLMLAVAEGCGPGMVPALLDPTADPRTLLTRPPADLPAAVRRRLAAPELVTRAAAWLEAAGRSDLEVWTPDHPSYPARLREAPLRPLCLFAGGRAAAAAVRAVAVVGSRAPTPYGLAATRDFTRACAEAGLAIWSGLAFGVDAAAHETALESGVPTVAVLAGGLDQPHPVAHQGLARRIVRAGGLCLSEAPPGLRPTRGHFPRRNRILAGSVEAVLVIEAGERSGALHTARFAADAGVTVFAVPGPYTSPRSRGCHRLIAEGAVIAADPGTVLAELGLEFSLHGDREGAAALQLCGDEQRVIATLLGGPRPTDGAARESGLGEDRFLEVVYRLLERGALVRLTGDLLAIGRSGGGGSGGTRT